MFAWLKRVCLSFVFFGLLAASAQAQGRSGEIPGAGLPTGPVPGQYIVILTDDIENPRAMARDMAQSHGFRVGHVYSHVLKGFSARLSDAAVAALSSNPAVDHITQDQWARVEAQVIPTGIDRIFAMSNGAIPIADGNADELGVDVDVAVVDTGADLDHTDLNVVDAVSCANGGPFGGNCKKGGSEGDDGNGHGTHVSGTIGGRDNDSGVVGVAPGARIWAVQVLGSNGSGWLSWLLGGMDYVHANAASIEVANMSLGFGSDVPDVCTAISNSVAAGIVYVVAAGNEDADASGSSPGNCADAITVSALADSNGVDDLLDGAPFSTCRSDEEDTLANFSNWGSAVDIAAPGVCIESTWNDGGTNAISGTSMASPHVAGAAALLASVSPPANGGDVATLTTTLINNGNNGWTDDSGDGAQEPLLDVGNSGVFAPATVILSGTPPPPEPEPDPTPPGDVAVDGITPFAMDAGTTIDVTVTGSGFLPGATLTFEGGKGSKPTAAGVVVMGDGLSLTASVSANSKGKSGTFALDVVVTNSDGSTGSLPGAFTLTR